MSQAKIRKVHDSIKSNYKRRGETNDKGIPKLVIMI